MARERPEVTLQPPPRPGSPVFRLAPAPPPRAPRRPVGPRVALLAGVLSLLVAGVFVILPRWMARRPQSAAAAPPPADHVAPPSTVPAPPAAAAPATPTPVLTAEEPVDEPADEAAAAAIARPAPAAAADAPPPDWTRGMSEGLAALDAGQFAEARAAFARAETARPGTRVVAEAMHRAAEGLKVEALSAHRERGRAAEAGEDWKAALSAYDAALKLEPQVAFALEGRSRSRPRAEMDDRLASYLQRPDRLSADAVSREAEGVLDRARAITPAGPRLQQQAATLERLLREARTPLDVRLVSDGLTEVVVQRVGTLGAFRERNVPLRPGSYVVVGRRQGYRDTRKTIVVTPARIPPPLDVRCDQTL